MNITTVVKKHDNYQLEFKTVYPIDPELKNNEYTADVFFFLPRNLAVNEYSFSSHEFYNDFSEYIRFKTPSFTVRDLVNKNNKVVNQLFHAADILPEKSGKFNDSLKMFCSIVKSALRDSSAQIFESPAAEQEKMLYEYMDCAAAVLTKYRELKIKLKDHPVELELFCLVDEFLSLTLNRYLYAQWEHFIKNHPDMENAVRKIAAATGYEISYRKKCKYPAVPEIGEDNSELLYRESALKKSLANILFLNVETKRDGIVLENIFMSLAAAVAMIFATAVAFLWQGLYLEEFSVSFFAVWVIAYMFKDRIKSQLQLFFLSRRDRYSYDYQQKIFDGFNNEIGVFHEGFRYCDGKDIDEKITSVRNRTTVSRLVNGSLEENVLVYRKKIQLKGNSCKDIFREFNVDGVVNIYRLNVRHWLHKMDNPVRQIYYSDGRNISTMTAKRDYHINIIMRIGGVNCREQYVRYRLILCRDGIRKLIKIEDDVSGK